VTRSLVLSDLHSNLEALLAVLDDARGLAYDRVLILGDVVGYGADPGGVIEILRGLPGVVAVRGNHDRVAAGLEEGKEFNVAARSAVQWTRRALDGPGREYLRTLPQGPREFAAGRLLCHGTPLDEDEYLLEETVARRSFEAIPFDLCFFGHTHFPCHVSAEGTRVRLRAAEGDRAEFALSPGARHMINPGSVGQPRDRNPKSSYAVYDDADATVTIHRVAYPVEVVRRKILDAGLPRWLGDRLLLGV
jgi:diadenosine tetraphosphatase ApaH/serine/threonine PP2A family protein phosphatase